MLIPDEINVGELALRLKKGEDALKFGRKLVEDYAENAPKAEP